MTQSSGIDRIGNLDFVRGIATLGILVMNAVSFGLPSAAYWNLAASGSETGLHWVVGIFSKIFVDQKMMALFSLLFGASIVLFIDAAKKRGPARPILGLYSSPIWLSLWRNLWLFVIGLLHMLLWEGDILQVYAICAPIILFVRNWHPKLLLGLGTFLITTQALLVLLLQPLFLSDGSLDITTNWARAIGDDIGLGKYWFVESTKLGDTVGLWLLVNFFGRALGMMFIGVALYRMTILQGTRSVGFYRRMAVIGIMVGLPLAITSVVWQLASDFSPDIALISTIPTNLATIPLTLGYLGVLTIWHLRVDSWVHARIRAIGRMALTNYLTQTIIGITVLRIILDQGSLSRSGIALFIVVVWTLQITWSEPWLKRYPYGPFEWIWRKLTYREFRMARSKHSQN